LGFLKIENSLSQTFYINLKTLERHPINWLTDGTPQLEIFNAGSMKFIKTITKKSSVEATEDFVIERF
jgi:hypothetical protein